MRLLKLTLGLIVALIFIVTLTLTLSATVQAAPQAPAAVCTWDGSTGNWSDSAHWPGCGAPGGVPDNGDTAIINGGAVNIASAVTIRDLTLNGGVLHGSNGITVTRVMTWTTGTQEGSGTTTIAPGATLNVTGNGMLRQRTLNNAGTLNWTAADTWYMDSNAVVNNLPGATFHAQANGVSLGAVNGTFNNQGTFVRSGPGFSAVTALAFNNTGTVNVQSGVLQFNSEFVQSAGATWLNGGNLARSGSFVFNGGALRGTGIITGNVSNVGGTVSPGSSPGVLHIAGNYTQGPTGTLNLELGGVISGTQYDLLDVTGAASLSGTLNVSLLNAFTPISGTVFRVVNFSTRSGDFITKTGTSLDWLSLLPYYSSEHLSLVAATTMADLGISATDDKWYAVAGDPITYTVVVTNAGPDVAVGAIVTDTLPGIISNVTWTCVAAGGSCSAPSGSGNLSTMVNLNASGVITFTLGGRLSSVATGTLIDTAYVSHPTDPNANNNSAMDRDIVLHIKLYLPLIIN